MTTIPWIQSGGPWQTGGDGDGPIFGPLDPADVGLPPIFGDPAGPGADAAERAEIQRRLEAANDAIKPGWQLWLESIARGIADTFSLTDPATRPAGNVGLFDWAPAIVGGVNDTAEAASGAVVSVAESVRSAAPFVVFGLAGLLLWRVYKS